MKRFTFLNILSVVGVLGALLAGQQSMADDRHDGDRGNLHKEVRPPAPQPAPPVAHPNPNIAPQGQIEAVLQNNGGMFVGGWACIFTDANVNVEVDVYVDGAAGAGGTFIGRTKANLYNSSQLQFDTCRSTNHGFAVSIPVRYLDGLTHTVYAYALDFYSRPAMNSMLVNYGMPFRFVRY